MVWSSPHAKWILWQTFCIQAQFPERNINRIEHSKYFSSFPPTMIPSNKRSQTSHGNLYSAPQPNTTTHPTCTSSDTVLIGISLTRGVGGALHNHGIDVTTYTYAGTHIPHTSMTYSRAFQSIIPVPTCDSPVQRDWPRGTIHGLRRLPVRVVTDKWYSALMPICAYNCEIPPQWAKHLFCVKLPPWTPILGLGHETMVCVYIFLYFFRKWIMFSACMFQSPSSISGETWYISTKMVFSSMRPPWPCACKV